MTSPEHVLGKLISDAVESALGAEFEVVYQWFYRLEESAHRPGLRRDLGLCATRKWDRTQCAYIFRDFHFQKGDVESAAASIQRWMNENGKEESMSGKNASLIGNVELAFAAWRKAFESNASPEAQRELWKEYKKLLDRLEATNP